MSIWNFLTGRRAPAIPQAHPQPKKRAPRKLAFEKMERRDLLSADPLHLGAVYYEDAFVSGTDSTPPGDLLQFTFNGGAEGTQLQSLTIELDPDSLGIEPGARFFDTAAGGLGASGHLPLTIVSNQGIDQITFTLNSNQLDGTTTLTINFVGFNAGDKLVLGLDVDEHGRNGTQTPTVEGIEFEGSTITAAFTAPTYYDFSGTATFFDQYSFGNTGLNLPPDSYIPPGTNPANDYTAGALLNGQQQSLPVEISGTVFEDMDGDNHLDADEDGIGGVHLALLVRQGDTYVATGLTTITDENGQYHFSADDRGDYRVVETQPDGYFSVGATAGHVGSDPRGSVLSSDVITDITLVGGEHSVQNDFAEARPAELCGSVYHDANNNGVFDSGETGIAGVTLQLLDANGNATGITTTTGANGHYCFEGLTPGTYSVAEVQPSGYIDGLDTPGNAGGVAHNPGDLISGVTLLSGQHGENYNFGELLPGSIAGHVHADLDGDCVFDPEESGIAGVTIQLFDGAGNLIATTTTDANGNYLFANLTPGTYTVHEVQPSGYYDSGDHIGSAGGVRSANDTISQINLGSNVDAVNYNFCEVPPANISGRVHADLDGDCVFDPKETGIAGVTIQLLDENGNIVATTVTDANGQYHFDNLRPGEYGIHEVQPAGYLDSGDHPGSAGGIRTANDTIQEINLGPGVTAVNYNFCEVPPASISGRVHADLDGDCVLDPGEQTLAGVTIELLDADGNVIATTVTGADGTYHFDNLRPGEYGIREIQPAGYLDSGDHPGSAGGVRTANDTIQQIVLGAGINAVDYNFCEIPPATISGYVYQDGATIRTSGVLSTSDLAAIRDGLHTGDDAPIAGVTLILTDGAGNPILDSSGNPITTVTDANGYYQFTMLRDGSYGVRELQPSGYIDWLDFAGSAGGNAQNPGDQITSITLARGQHSTDNNFSELRVEAPPAMIPPPARPETVIVMSPPFIYPAIVPVGLPAATPPLSPPGIPVGGGGGGGGGEGWTWHLSVIDGGQPRGADEVVQERVPTFPANFDAETWNGQPLDGGTFTLVETAAGAPNGRSLNFGISGATPVVGDFNGDGVADVGVYHDGNWYLDLNGNGQWDQGDLWAKLGKPGDKPITGDWDGDGKTDIGVFGPAWEGDDRALAREPGLPGADNDSRGQAKNVPPNDDEGPVEQRLLKRTSTGKVRADVIDHVFEYGRPGDMPVTGDWNGDGHDNIGVYRGGSFYLDMNGNGRWDGEDKIIDHGVYGQPVAGDFNGDGVDRLGVVVGKKWHIDSNSDGRFDELDKVFEIEGTGAPVVGDWNGSGVEQPGYYRDGAPPARREL